MAPPFIALAPMEGVSTFPMRLWWHLASAPTTLATPFLRVTSTYPRGGLPRAFCPELSALKSYLPYRVVPQMMAVAPQDFLRTAEYFLPHTPFVELNAGCPSPTCVGKGAGSSLLKEVSGFRELLEQLCHGLGDGAVALKMRTGFQDDGEFPALLGAVADLPLARLTVHGRTRPARYTGLARWDLIAAASAQVPKPVVASGDVVDAPSLARRLALAPRVAGVLVGRGALRNPWIFEELRTHASVRISFPVLALSLICQALLHELAERHEPGLLRLETLAKDGVFSASCGTDEERWRRVQLRLTDAVYGREVAFDDSDQSGRYPISRPALGRLKMLWNYLRSSLPEPFFAPTLLRSTDLGTLLMHLRLIHSQHRAAADAAGGLMLRYEPRWDWLYNGDKRQA